MRFGLFYELQLPRPWGQGAEEQLFKDSLDQIELADRLGFDFLWQVEHHFLEEYSHSSSPEVFLGAASQRTRRIRLGHGIVQLPPAFNHPVRVAERIATLDLLSNGRVEFGSGQGSSQAELGGFGIDRQTKHKQWKEALETIVRMMVEEPFAGYEGEFISVPPRNIVPKPKQKPHPPLWVACSRRESIVNAGHHGLGALSFSFLEPEQARELAAGYYTAVIAPEAEPIGFAANPNFAVVLPLMCHRQEETAVNRGTEGSHFFWYSLAHYYGFGQHRPGNTNLWQEFCDRGADYGFSGNVNTGTGARILQEGIGAFGGAIGTPSQILALLRRYEQAGVDQVIFACQIGRNLHEHICESLELFAREVLPPFQASAETHEKTKAERLAEAAGRTRSRRVFSKPELNGYVITPQGEPTPARTATLPQHSRLDGHGRKWLEATFAEFVRKRSDKQLERLIRGPSLWLIFKEMERAYVPEKSRGFSGYIQFELRAEKRYYSWHLAVLRGKAKARRGSAPDATVKLQMSIPVFARITAGVLDPTRAIFERALTVDGEIRVVLHLNEMFGRPSNY